MRLESSIYIKMGKFQLLYGMHYIIDYFRVFRIDTKKFGWIPPKSKEINEDLRSVKVCNSNTW